MQWHVLPNTKCRRAQRLKYNVTEVIAIPSSYYLLYAYWYYFSVCLNDIHIYIFFFQLIWMVQSSYSHTTHFRNTSRVALIQSPSRCSTVPSLLVRVSSCGLWWYFSAGSLPAQPQFRPKWMAWQEKCQPLLNPGEPGFLLATAKYRSLLAAFRTAHNSQVFTLTMLGINGKTLIDMWPARDKRFSVEISK